MWRVLVAGAGPAGLYVCRNLIKLPINMCIDLYEKSNSLYGLLNSGVSPDKTSIKSIMSSFDSTLSDSKIKLHLGRVVGESISIPEIAKNYDFLILCTGALVPRDIRIPGEGGGVFQALDFCNYYNGIVSKKTENILTHLRRRPTIATVIGNGNVSLDVSRMLLYPKTSLKNWLSEHVLNDMPEVERVYIIGRGGWINAKFTNAELSFIIKSGIFHPIVSPKDYEASLDGSTLLSNRAMERRKKLIEMMVDNYHKNGDLIMEFIFHSNVSEITNNTQGMSIGIRGANRTIESDILIKALGFERDELTMEILSNENSNLFKENKCHLFTVGWSRKGATGDLSTTIMQAKECYEFVEQITSQLKPKNANP